MFCRAVQCNTLNRESAIQFHTMGLYTILCFITVSKVAIMLYYAMPFFIMTKFITVLNYATLNYCMGPTMLCYTIPCVVILTLPNNTVRLNMLHDSSLSTKILRRL